MMLEAVFVMLVSLEPNVTPVMMDITNQTHLPVQVFHSILLIITLYIIAFFKKNVQLDGFIMMVHVT